MGVKKRTKSTKQTTTRAAATPVKRAPNSASRRGKRVTDRVRVDAKNNHPPIDQALAQREFEKNLPEMRTVAPRDFLRITVDTLGAAGTALGALARIEESGQFKNIGTKFRARLKSLAFALFYATTRVREMSDAQQSALEDSVSAGTELREQFIAAARALVTKKLFDPKVLADLLAGHGYRDLAADLTAYATIWRKNAKRYRGLSIITDADVKAAAQLGTKILAAASTRAKSPAEYREAVEYKTRAWTLFARDYNQLRKDVSYARWDDGDAAEFAPSLYEIAGSGRPPADHPSNPVDATPNDDAKDTVQRIAGERVSATQLKPGAPAGDDDEIPEMPAAGAKARRGGNPFGG